VLNLGLEKPILVKFRVQFEILSTQNFLDVGNLQLSVKILCKS